MKLNFASMARLYILFFGLIHFHHLISLLGIYETLVSAPSSLSLWWWHLILFLGYGFYPLVTLVRNNERFLIMLTGVAGIGILLELFKVFTLVKDFGLIFILLNSVTVIFSLSLAVEDVSIQVAAEILSYERSQF